MLAPFPFLAASFALLGSNAGVVVRTPAPPPHTHKGTIAGVKAVARAFDPNVSMLPRHFTGLDLTSVTRALLAQGDLRKKDSFESTAEYAARIQRLDRSPFLGQVRFGDTVAVSFAESGRSLWALWSGLSSEYDADQEIFKVSLRTDHIRDSEGGPYDLTFAAVCTPGESERSQYRAMNGFGASFTVEKFAQSYECLRFLKAFVLQDGRPFLEEGRLDFELPAPRSKARAIAATLRALVIGKIIDPKMKIGGSTITPTFKDSLDAAFFFSYIKFLPSEILFYDYDSGAIYRRFSLTYKPTE